MRRCAQSSQRSTCPPSAAVRQISIAVITRRWARLTWAALAVRHASPWRRKISATSSFGWGMAGVSGGRCQLHVQEFQRALDFPDGVDCDPCIAGCRRNVTMAEQILDHMNVDTLFQEVSSKAMTQRVHGD